VRCRTLFFLLTLTASILALIPRANANPFILTNPQYFTSMNGAYIYFPSSVLPRAFSNWYYTGSSLYRNYFNDTIWITTTSTMTITQWFENTWLNFTVAGAGTQQIHNTAAAQPQSVYIDGTQRYSGDGWIFSSGALTITSATSSVSVYYGIPEEWGDDAITTEQ
jgi:hypothetical protein